MKKILKRAFTIVELVIVIAVIAILAAVLIPTFSNVIRKANLSADKQAVREMNMALAAYEAEYGYGKVVSVEDAMQVLANAGYNSENWVCLTSGYQVYWYDEANRCILYNSGTSEIEYPEDYIGAYTKDGNKLIMLSDHVHIYNENHVKAQQFKMSLSSSTATVNENGTSISSAATDGSKTIINGTVLSSTTQSSKDNLTALSSASAQSIIKSALGGNDSSELKVYATKEVISGDTSSAYASLQISSMAVAATDSAVTPVLRSDGNYEENVYYLTIVDNNGTPEQLASARKAAAQYVYNIFDQITESKIDDDVTIIVAPGTKLDCSTCEWAPCKQFTGYFGNGGSTAEADRIIIDGAQLSSLTSFSQTVQFQGSNVTVNGKTTYAQYYVTGFFGTVYGKTTIENVTFKNLSIIDPAGDIASSEPTAIRRNTVALIGGVTGGNFDDKDDCVTPQVTIKNVVMESSCYIQGLANAGGLIGYIGDASETSKNSIMGTDSYVDIINCHISATVKGGAYLNNASYSDYCNSAGLIAYMGRTAGTIVNINNTTFDGVCEGDAQMNAVIGDIYGGTQTINFIGNNDFSNAKLGETALNYKLSESTESSRRAIVERIIPSGYPKYVGMMGRTKGTKINFYTVDQYKASLDSNDVRKNETYTDGTTAIISGFPVYVYNINDNSYRNNLDYLVYTLKNQ